MQLILRLWSRSSKISNLEASDASAIGTTTFDLKTDDCSDSLPLRVREQNAALILRRTSVGIQFDCFEASPHPRDVMTTNGALIWPIPTDSVTVTWGKASNSTFRTQLAKFLDDACIESIPSMIPESYKAGAFVPEIRDTANPKLVLQMVMNVLAAYGWREKNENPTIKRVRDDVLWKSALRPWRRNPLWLVIRAALQTSFQTSSPSNGKSFMVYLMCQLSRLAVSKNLSSDLVQVASSKMSRRLAKLGSAGDAFIIKEALESASKARQYLQDDLDKKLTTSGSSQDLECGTTFEPECMNLKLSSSKAYIAKVLDGSSSTSANAKWIPEGKRSIIAATKLPDLESLKAGQNIELALADVGVWVTKHLGQWTESKLERHEDSTCIMLGELISTYYRNATSTYQRHPDQLSVAMLTCFELWQTLDRFVTSRHPLLTQYSPQIPLSLFEPLLLTRMDLLNRLHGFETYLTQRHRTLCPAIHQSTLTQRSIPLRSSTFPSQPLIKISKTR